MMNKKGQELSTNTIIMIILGLVVLVVLILGFTMGWDRFLPFISSNNIENLQTVCGSACATNNEYNYCTSPKEVNDGVNDKFTSTCFNLSTQFPERNYGIDACSGITCAQ